MRREFRGPVPALASIDGVLLVAARHRLKRHRLDGPSPLELSY